MIRIPNIFLPPNSLFHHPILVPIYICNQMILINNILKSVLRYYYIRIYMHTYNSWHHQHQKLSEHANMWTWMQYWHAQYSYAFLLDSCFFFIFNQLKILPHFDSSTTFWNNMYLGTNIRTYICIHTFSGWSILRIVRE